MARLLGLTLRMLRTLQAQRRQERLMRHLYEIQRSLSRRAPLADVLEMTLAAVVDVVGDDQGQVQLWLADTDVTEQTFTCTGSLGTGAAHLPPGPIDIAGPATTVIRTDRPLDYLDQTGQPSTAVPVHERGRTGGALAVTLSTGRTLNHAAIAAALPHARPFALTHVSRIG
jgi:hypothetical protein